MATPPPVSGESYRIETGLEEKKNYISGGVLGGGGYTDNLYPGTGNPLQEGIISLQPSIAFDTSSARQHTAFLYNPIFIFYQPDGAYNEADQSLLADLSYRFSPRLATHLEDRLLRSSNGFGQIGNDISGGAVTSTPNVIVPYGERFMNTAGGGLSYQLTPHGMIGGSGNTSFLNYPKSSQVPGLYNSDSRGGSGFYNARISASQYLGALYQYQQSLTYVSNEQYETQTHAIFGFYTLYLSESFSMSVAGGPQHFISTRTGFPSVSAWTPAVTTSLGWQNPHFSGAAYFSRIVTGGSGLVGTFYSRSTGASGRWQIDRMWNAGADISYAINKNAVVGTALGSSGGHTFATSVNVGRTLTDRMSVLFNYARLQSRYDGITVFEANPSSDRVMVSLQWHFERPIGR